MSPVPGERKRGTVGNELIRSVVNLFSYGCIVNKVRRERERETRFNWPFRHRPLTVRKLLNLSLSLAPTLLGSIHELLRRILSWSRLLYQHVSLSSPGTPQCPVIHHHVIPSLVLEPKLLPSVCLPIYPQGPSPKVSRLT